MERAKGCKVVGTEVSGRFFPKMKGNEERDEF